MPIVIRDVQESDLDAVLALNNAAGPGIWPISAARMHHLFEHAEYFRVVEREDHLAGFLIAFGSDSGHDSPNFRWFAERYPAFLYIDRIVIASRRRSGGVGRTLYADVQSYAEAHYPELCCEVFMQTGTDPALLFHGSVGFTEIGQAPQADGTRASMQVKHLRSHDWIRQTYGNTLPDVPWLLAPRTAAERPRSTGVSP